MDKLQKILDIWIEKGAVYNGVEYSEAERAWDYINFFETKEDYIWSPSCYISINDILYWDSNFWEVMFHSDGYVENDMYFFGEDPYYYKTQSVLQENKIDWLYELLPPNE